MSRNATSEHVAELLPWLLNGTLGTAEEVRVREHLESCPDCRRELEEASFALEVFADHISSEELTAYAFDSPSLDDTTRGGIEQHLEDCQSCTGELEMLRESRQALEEDAAPAGEVIPFARPALVEATVSISPMWRSAALAAGLAGVVCAAGWYRAVHSQGDAGARLAELERRIAQLAAPDLNIPVFDVFPGELNVRAGEPEDENELAPAVGSRQLTLILISQSTVEFDAYELELEDGEGRVLWTGEGLERHAAGDFTVSLPTDLLPPGSSTLRLYGRRGEDRVAVERYPMRMPSAPPFP